MADPGGGAISTNIQSQQAAKAQGGNAQIASPLSQMFGCVDQLLDNIQKIQDTEPIVGQAMGIPSPLTGLDPSGPHGPFGLGALLFGKKPATGLVEYFAHGNQEGDEQKQKHEQHDQETKSRHQEEDQKHHAQEQESQAKHHQEGSHPKHDSPHDDHERERQHSHAHNARNEQEYHDQYKQQSSRQESPGNQAGRMSPRDHDGRSHDTWADHHQRVAREHSETRRKENEAKQFQNRWTRR